MTVWCALGKINFLNGRGGLDPQCETKISLTFGSFSTALALPGACFISQKVFVNSFCESEFPHKSVNLFFLISNDKKLVEGFVRGLTCAKQLHRYFL